MGQSNTQHKKYYAIRISSSTRQNINVSVTEKESNARSNKQQQRRQLSKQKGRTNGETLREQTLTEQKSNRNN